MRITKKWKSVLEDIYSILGNRIVHELHIDIPEGILLNPREDSIDWHQKQYSNYFINISSVKKLDGKQDNIDIKIFFGKKRELIHKTNEIIIEFEFLPEIISYIISSMSIDELYIQTKKDLFRKDLSPDSVTNPSSKKH